MPTYDADAFLSPVIHCLMTGNELMSGVTVDSNSAVIAQRLEPFNLALASKVTVGDESALLEAEIARLAAQGSVLLVNGGLGPTQDDLTAEALARVCGVGLAEHPEALAHLESWCARRGFELNEANRKQALLPAGCAVIPNPVGSAVGFHMRLGDCDILCTPGVPSELYRMLDAQILPWLREQFPTPGKLTISRYQLFGLGESSLQQLISDSFPDWPKEIELGFRAGAPQLELKLTSRDQEHEALRELWETRIRDLIGDYIVGTGDATLPDRVIELLASRRQTVATAESCTGGMIASMLTGVPGASQVIEAGFVTYSNRMKQDMLGVSAQTLQREGAVSDATVIEMAAGALSRSGADYAVAVSGIAGPGGGSEGKPVGLVHVAWGDTKRLQTCQLFFPFGRQMFQTVVASTGLDLLRRRLLAIDSEPRYFKDRALKEPRRG